MTVVSIPAAEITASLLAIPAFLPATFSVGYSAAWLLNLHQFRQRSLVERCFWSVPLSVAISTIAAVLLGKYFSLAAGSTFLCACGAISLVIFVLEWFQRRASDKKWIIGFKPLGGTALFFVGVWITVAILSLIDLQSDHQLFMSLTIFDHAARVNWTESILRTGVPPANPLFLFKHPATLRYYYFWNVVCAAVAQTWHLPVRAVFIASCVWGGLIVAALIGLYLKHFLPCGIRLRKQLLTALLLLMVSGLNSCVNIWRFIDQHQGLPGPPVVWDVGEINSWYDSLLLVPHHIASLVCCMLAFLLAWMDGKDGKRQSVTTVALIAVALASAFGLSIYVSFGFFLVMLVWAFWQVVIEKVFRPVLLLTAGGAGAVVLLLPYLRELARNSSGMHGGHMFGIAVRETFAPDGLLASPLLHPLATGHPLIARNLADLLMLIPGLVIELGFFFVVFLIYLVPAWRGRTRLSPAQRSLIVIAASTILFSSLIRSQVLNVNDFGLRTALLLQIVTILLASELITKWKSDDNKRRASANVTLLPRHTPLWVRLTATLALVLGTITTLHQAIIFRFTIPLAYAVTHMRAVQDPVPGSISHNAYISYIGYGELDAAIPHDAVVQANPASPNFFWTMIDWVGINHQTAIAGDKPWCGAELGGDTSGCAPMAAAIDSLFNGAGADQARTTCREYGIGYLVARVYDPAWKGKNSWVWTLRPVVSDEEFRVLDCR